MPTDLQPTAPVDAPVRRQHHRDEFLVLHRRMVAAGWQVAVRYFEAWTGAEQLAGEAVDEAMVRAADRWGRVRRRGNAEAWVALATLEACRRRARREPVEGKRAERPNLGDAIGQLPRRKREVIVLRRWVGLTDAEVALYLGIGREAVTGHAVSAWASLRDMLGRDPF